MTLLQIIIVAIMALAGGMTVALLGWGDSGEPFNPKKFAMSIVHSIIAAVVVAAAFNYTVLTSPIGYLFAFLSGAGIDAGLNRFEGTVVAKVAARLRQ